MQKDDLVYAGHMLDMAEKARQKVAGRSRDEFILVVGQFGISYNRQPNVGALA